MSEVSGTPARTGQATEIERVYREEGPRLWRAILAFTGDREVTNEVVAETFAQCLRRGPGVREASRWIWRAAFRIAAGELQERGAPPPMDRQGADEPPERAEQLVGALQQLPPRQRAAIVLRYYLGYTPREIAGILGTAPPTARVHLMRGLRRLRTLMEEEDHED